MVVHYLSLWIESQTIDENCSNLGNLDHHFQLQWHGSNHAEGRVHRALQSDGASAGGRVFSLETDAGSILSVYSRAVEETSCPTHRNQRNLWVRGLGKRRWCWESCEWRAGSTRWRRPSDRNRVHQLRRSHLVGCRLHRPLQGQQELLGNRHGESEGPADRPSHLCPGPAIAIYLFRRNRRQHRDCGLGSRVRARLISRKAATLVTAFSAVNDLCESLKTRGLSVSAPRVHRARRRRPVRDHGLFRRLRPVDHHGRDHPHGLGDLCGDDPDHGLRQLVQPAVHRD
jgi:hypothetical protein